MQVLLGLFMAATLSCCSAQDVPAPSAFTARHIEVGVLGPFLRPPQSTTASSSRYLTPPAPYNASSPSASFEYFPYEQALVTRVVSARLSRQLDVPVRLLWGYTDLDPLTANRAALQLVLGQGTQDPNNQQGDEPDQPDQPDVCGASASVARPSPFGFVGTWHPDVAKSVSSVLSARGVPLVSSQVGARELSNNDLYPTFSRVAANELDEVIMLAVLMKSRGWERVSIVYRADSVYRALAADVAGQFTSTGIEVLHRWPVRTVDTDDDEEDEAEDTSEGVSVDEAVEGSRQRRAKPLDREHLEGLLARASDKPDRSRVFLLVFPPDDATAVMRSVIRAGMNLPRFNYLTTSHWMNNDQLLRFSDAESAEERRQLRAAMVGMLGVRTVAMPDSVAAGAVAEAFASRDALRAEITSLGLSDRDLENLREFAESFERLHEARRQIDAVQIFVRAAKHLLDIDTQCANKPMSTLISNPYLGTHCPKEMLLPSSTFGFADEVDDLGLDGYDFSQVQCDKTGCSWCEDGCSSKTVNASDCCQGICRDAFRQRHSSDVPSFCCSPKVFPFDLFTGVAISPTDTSRLLIPAANWRCCEKWRFTTDANVEYKCARRPEDEDYDEPDDSTGVATKRRGMTTSSVTENLPTFITLPRHRLSEFHLSPWLLNNRDDPALDDGVRLFNVHSMQWTCGALHVEEARNQMLVAMIRGWESPEGQPDSSGPVTLNCHGDNSRTYYSVQIQEDAENGTIAMEVIGDFEPVERDFLTEDEQEELGDDGYVDVDSELEYYFERDGAVDASTVSTRDGVPTVVQYQTVGSTVVLIVLGVTGFGMLVLLFFMAFQIYYRKVPRVSVSSWRFNLIIIFGSFMGLWFNITETIRVSEADGGISKSQFASTCTAAMWLLVLGFTLSFGALLAKTYRIYMIFTARLAELKRLTDRVLFTVLGVLLVLDALLLAIATAFYRFERGEKVIDNTYDAGLDADVETRRYSCDADGGGELVAVVVATKAALLVCGLYLALQLRHFEDKVLNESSRILYAVCHFVWVAAATSTAAFTTQDVERRHLALTMGVWLISVGVVLIFFSSTVWDVLVRGNTGLHDGAKEERDFVAEIELEHSIRDLQARNRELELENQRLKAAMDCMRRGQSFAEATSTMDLTSLSHNKSSSMEISTIRLNASSRTCAAGASSRKSSTTSADLENGNESDSLADLSE